MYTPEAMSWRASQSSGEDMRLRARSPRSSSSSMRRFTWLGLYMGMDIDIDGYMSQS